MRVRCIKEYGVLEINKEYTVYGLELWKGRLRYHICDADEHKFALFFEAGLFEITDNRVSQIWHIKFSDDGYCIITYKEGVENDEFINNVVEGYPKEVEIFLKYKKIMDDEFPDAKS
jgi:hypothetical protein